MMILLIGISNLGIISEFKSPAPHLSRVESTDPKSYAWVVGAIAVVSAIF